jgi:Flp pilus assembly protein TadB
MRLIEPTEGDAMSDRRARPGYHDPTSGMWGAAPTRSALTLRLVLAAFGLVVCLAGCVTAVILDLAAIAVVLGVAALIAAVDLVVVARRKRRGEPG